MNDAFDKFKEIPGRLLLDTCVLNLLQDEGEYIFEGQVPDGYSLNSIPKDLVGLRQIFQVNQRASFQFLVSPITFAELANHKDMLISQRRIQWALDVIDVWLIMLEDISDRIGEGGSVRHRFKLNSELQELERRLLEEPDFSRDPLDRLLLINYKMGNCDAFLTLDRNTIWRHRNLLMTVGIRVLRPSDFWEILKPWSGIWY
jgi:hypothetical protein